MFTNKLFRIEFRIFKIKMAGSNKKEKSIALVETKIFLHFTNVNSSKTLNKEYK